MHCTSRRRNRPSTAKWTVWCDWKCDWTKNVKVHCCKVWFCFLYYTDLKMTPTMQAWIMTPTMDWGKLLQHNISRSRGQDARCLLEDDCWHPTFQGSPASVLTKVALGTTRAIVRKTRPGVGQYGAQLLGKHKYRQWWGWAQLCCNSLLNAHDEDGLRTLLRRLPPPVPDGVLGLHAGIIIFSFHKNIFISRKSQTRSFRRQTTLLLATL